MKKINIIQFLPYYIPHKGGLESHSEQWGKWWVKKNFGEVFNVVTSFEQSSLLGEKIVFEGDIIGYKKDGVKNLIVPSFEIISNFPIYKIWTKKYRQIFEYLKEKKIDIIITRTRFFTTSLVGGIFARKNKIKWVHIEHGSDYVKLNSGFKNFVAKVYDKLIGKWIFKKADKLVGVSNACKKFIHDEFVDREVDIIYRGLDFESIKDDNSLRKKFPGKIIVGFVGRLYKWKNIDTLIQAYYNLDGEVKNKIQIVIVGDGEDFDILNKIDFENKIYFTGGVTFKKALELQKQFDIHFHTSSKGGGLATTLLQAMYLGCLIVSTPYEGADEVVINGLNGILLVDDSLKEIIKGLEKGIEMINKKEEFALVNRSIIEEDFMWDKNIEKYRNLIN